METRVAMLTGRLSDGTCGCMDVWYGCMDVWMYGWMDGWMFGMYYYCTTSSQGPGEVECTIDGRRQWMRSRGLG
jgi:hypothetical protein